MLPLLAKGLISPKAIKTTATVAGVAVAGYVGYRVYKKWKKGKDKRAFTRQLENMEINRSSLHYAETDFNLMIQDLLAAMDGSGTREKTVVSVFTQPSMERDDILKLIKDFGIREYGWSGKPGWWSKTFSTPQPLNLIGWLKAEMTGRELEDVRAVFRKNNIPF